MLLKLSVGSAGRELQIVGAAWQNDSYGIDLKRQNRLKSWNRQAYKLKVKMQSVSDDDVRRFVM